MHIGGGGGGVGQNATSPSPVQKVSRHHVGTVANVPKNPSHSFAQHSRLLEGLSQQHTGSVNMVCLSHIGGGGGGDGQNSGSPSSPEQKLSTHQPRTSPFLSSWSAQSSKQHSPGESQQHSLNKAGLMHIGCSRVQKSGSSDLPLQNLGLHQAGRKPPVKWYISWQSWRQNEGLA